METHSLSSFKRVLVLAAATFSMLLAACSPVQFSAKGADPVAPNDPTAIGDGDPNCIPTVENILRPTKLLFVVDTSGSNADSSTWMNTYIPATDPYKTFRYGAIADFLARYRHKTNFSWSFVTFSGDSARALINTGSHFRPSFDSPDLMYSALSYFYRDDRDQGMTPYGAALDMAREAIHRDPDLRSNGNPQYVVILLTDGFPTDYLDRHNRFDQTAIDADIQSLLAVGPQQIRLSTIFYGRVLIPQAATLLQNIALQGGGHFATVNDPHSGFKIEDVIPGKITPCQ